jgi:hypothetical protein
VTNWPHPVAVGNAPFEAPKRLPTDGDPRSEIVAAHFLARDCLVILGWIKGDIAAEGAAILTAAGGDQGRFRATSWPAGEGQERWYVAAVRVPEIRGVKPGEALLLHGAGATGPMTVRLPDSIGDSAAFAAELRNRASGRLNHAVKFLLETFSSRASRQLAAVSAFLAAVLDSAAQEEGVVELLGTIDGEGFLLQGWVCHALAGRQHLLLLGEVLDEHEAICANYPRSDLDGRGAGMLALVRPKGGARINTLRSVYLRAGDNFYRLTVLPNLMRLRDEEAPAHLRAMLPTLLVDEALRQNLRAAVRPRFSGVDTLSDLDQPVRMAVDLAAHIPMVGWYVTGWMLDPASLVAKVLLRDRDGMAERLDVRWTRVRREDVSAGFRSDPLFHGLLHDDLHGFTIFIQHRSANPQSWIELQFNDEHLAFMSLQAVSGEGGDGRRRLLESFDVHKPSASEIVDRHMGPLFHAAKSSPRRKVGYRVLRPWSAKPETALIIPILESDTRTKVVVAELASRNPGKGIATLFVCSSALGEGTNALLREIAFYGLDAQILVADAVVDHCEALDIGVRATDMARLVFMAPSTHPLRANWAADLLAVQADAGEPFVVTPTLVYEDWSICYAGMDGIRFLDAVPFADPAYARAGYPREAIRETGVSAALAGSLDCCAMSRSAYEQLDGFGCGYALAKANGLDLFLRMRKAGVRVLWMPQVEAYTLGDLSAQNDYWMQTGELVDGWSLRASWRDRLPAIADVSYEAIASADDRSPPEQITPRSDSGFGRQRDGVVAAELRRIA